MKEFRLGPDNATLAIRTYREGVAARAGHDLIIDVGSWSAIGGDGGIELTADPSSLAVRAGVGGPGRLSDRDRAQIEERIVTQVLGEQAIGFRSTDTVPTAETLWVEGDLTINGVTRRIHATLPIDEDGRVSGTIELRQTDFGITPFRGMFGALRVRDTIEVVIDAALG